MPHVLVIEDERKLAKSLERGLRNANFDVTVADKGNEGLELAIRHGFDCIILDWMLPGTDGLTVLATLRKEDVLTPVLLLTARDAIEDRVLGLETGADDYLVKPFAFAELLARVKALLRRRQVDRETSLKVGDLELDLLARRLLHRGEAVSMTQREIDVLEYLMRHANQPVTREMLGRDVWKEPDYVLTNVAEVYVNLLRKKLDMPGAPSLIINIRGVGYMLKAET
jgi:DNA-binding response OmpR family regulator